MCGIIALLAKKEIKVSKFILNGLNQLQNRGYDSAGVSIIQNNTLITEKYASEKDNNALSKLAHIGEWETNIGIGHTRWATHGPKNDTNSHPQISYDKKISLVHNGIIENYEEIKNELIAKNIPFASQTDTEVIANLIAYYYQEGNVFIEAIQKTLSRLEGTWGLVIINTEEPNKLYCVRRGSPLLVSQNENFVIIASEQSGFNNMVSNYFVLEGNDLCEVSLHNNSVEIKTENKYKLRDATDQKFDTTPSPFPHWTIKEIEEQYMSSIRAISFGGRLLNEDKVKLGGLEGHIEILKNINNILFLGCGTSYHAGMLGVHYFKELCHFNYVQVIEGGEFTYKDIPKGGNTALIFLTQSGETKDLHKGIQIGRDNNLFLIGVVNIVDSMIAREVDCGVYLNAGREVGVASTKCFTNQAIILSLMGIWFSQIHNVNLNTRKEYIKNIRQIPIQIKKTIEITKNKKEALIQVINKDNLFLLGKGKAEVIAREGALKIKEISYIHAEGYSGSSLKHGPFALLCPDFPVILVAPDDENYSKMKNTFQEIRSRNAPILFITDDKHCKYENSLILPNNPIFGDLLSIISLQLFAYYISIKRGINPDFPRNLAKSVVVE